jgi:uncharacterized membrane protein
MTYRRVIAILSMISGLVAVYLHLAKIGLAGSLRCGGPGGCEFVQASAYGQLFGVDVALLGVIGYALIFLVAFVGSLGSLADDKRPTLALMALIYPAFAYTLWLKYAEFVILHGFCKWCVVSAVTITVSTVLVTLDWRRQKMLSFLTRSST